MKDLVLKYQNKEIYDLSCSETILYASNEYFNLGLEASHFKMIAPFSGGMYIEETCGIASASLTVLGILFTDGVAHNSPRLKEISKAYLERFTQIYGSINCGLLKSEYRDEFTGCKDLIVEASLILVDIVNEYQNS